MKSNDEDVSFRYWRTDPRRVGPAAVRKARHLLSQYRRGKNRGDDWLFMSHQSYDRELKR